MTWNMKFKRDTKMIHKEGDGFKILRMLFSWITVALHVPSFALEKLNPNGPLIVGLYHWKGHQHFFESEKTHFGRYANYILEDMQKISNGRYSEHDYVGR